MQRTEGIHKAAIQKLGHLGALLIGKARRVVVGGGVFYIDFLVRYVHVAADDYRLFLVQRLEVSAEVVLPLHAVVQPLQIALRIGRVDAYQIVCVKLGADHAPFMVVLVNAQPHSHVERLFFGKYCRAGIALLIGAVPYRGVAGHVQLYLIGTQLSFLKAERVCVYLIKVVHKALAHARAQTVYIPRYIFHADTPRPFPAD